MFKELENFFDFEDQKPFLTLITSKLTDGSFSVHHFLSFAIRNKRPVYFVNLSQTWSHYKSVQIKLGNAKELAEMVESGKLFVFDFMKQVDENLGAESKLDLETFDVKKIFKQLVEKLDKELRGKKEESAMLIIDDASLLDLIESGDATLLKLIYDLSDFKDNLNLVLYSQLFGLNKDLLSDLTFLADLYVQIENLSTGYSKDIQGQIKINKLDFLGKRIKEQTFLYKITERNLSLFPIGSHV